MTEPRMRARQKGQQFATGDLEAFLAAFGDDFRPLPETVKVLDEIVTDFIIETCHSAALCAHISHRAKIKVDDFKFALRKDPKKLGRVTELLTMDKSIKNARKAFDDQEGVLGKEKAGVKREVDGGGDGGPVKKVKREGRSAGG